MEKKDTQYFKLTWWLKDAANLLEDCTISVHNLERVLTPKDKVEQFWLRKGFFEHVRFQYEFSLVTRLYQFYAHAKADNEKQISFRGILRTLKKSPVDERLLRQPHDPSLGWGVQESLLETVKAIEKIVDKHSDLHERLRVWRNSYLVHWSPSKQPREEDRPTLGDLKQLTLDATEIYNKLSGGLGNGAFAFLPHMHSVDEIIRMLVERDRLYKIMESSL